MKLEQTIQRSKKSQSGIIGQTWQNNYVTKWEMIYHEILNISNSFQGITSSNKLSFGETDQYHKLGGSIWTLLNESTRKLKTSLAERGNPNLVTLWSMTKLHHFTTHDRAMCERKWLHRLDMIYDSYIEQSIKFSGRHRRALTNGILVCNMHAVHTFRAKWRNFGPAIETKKIYS